ncbi:MAG: hypothetical protein BWX62_01244 [Bacteroidetes bacterium ADurb.Bin037]|nr:MAG: hypothetical protein BWX62_01244 [Bacteroidetes bacterium ADurb.Bin037]HPW78853.1 nucleotidyltransferase [Bacteroidales bacterium]HQB55569.1 nucleotidyltransferase [Bacteroidales bacterium]
MQPTLVIMAAGMGSRYGGLKQFDGLGPNGETIMDYSIYDALRAGFGKIVFVIRESFREEFDRVCVARYGSHFPFEFVTQELQDIPAPYTPPPGREKPWGTGHALLATSKCVNTPFGIINADDFYGRNAFAVLAEFLKRKDLTRGSYAMIGYRLENTLSPSGPVSRGICRMDENGLLTDVVERFKIRKQENGQIVCDIPAKEGETVSMELDADDLCSMNCWGFLPDVYQKAEHLVKKFLANHVHEATSEYHLPTLVNDIIKSGEGTCRILRSNSHWFGVTYREDRDGVVARLARLHREGLYPDPLFP